MRSTERPLPGSKPRPVEWRAYGTERDRYEYETRIRDQGYFLVGWFIAIPTPEQLKSYGGRVYLRRWHDANVPGWGWKTIKSWDAPDVEAARELGHRVMDRIWSYLVAEVL